MRCFIGLDLAATPKLAIAQWRDKALPYFTKAVPVQNFHITLAFLDQVSLSQLDALCQELDSLDMPSFELTLDQLGYWSKPRILWLGCQHLPAALEGLAAEVSRIARQCHIPIQQRQYVPHVTLVRKAAETPPTPLLAPGFECTFKEFHLFESVSGENGVRYPIRKSWPLNTFRRPKAPIRHTRSFPD